MKIANFSEMLEEIHRERGISKESLVEALRASLLSAAKKYLNQEENLEAVVSSEGELRILLKQEDGSEKDVTPSDFGRLAAQTAKQVIVQRMREAEKEETFAEFSHKAGEVVTGIVQHKETAGYLINLGRVETLLAFSETLPAENFRPRDYIKLYVAEVKKAPKGPLVIVSRAHPNLVRKLFEAEVPEIKEGIIEIKAVAREPGRRSKIAVFSHDENVGAVGTCIGHLGARIQNILKELKTEKIDVIEWSEDPAVFIANALSPAKIVRVEADPAKQAARVIVSDRELSLAIGKEGQNVRLAVRLTGWKIDILSEKEAEDKKGP